MELLLTVLLENGIELIGADEVFKRVKNWKNYFISNYGRLIKRNKNRKLHIVNPSITSGGYLTYTLSKPARKCNGEKVRDKNGRPKTQKECKTAQNMVARMFVYNPYPHMKYTIEDLQAHHKDKNRTNNYYKNLMLVASEEHGFLHRIKKVAIYDSNKCTYRGYKDIEELLDKLDMNIIELHEEVERLDRKEEVVRDGKWTIYRINGRYVAIEYYKS